MHTDFRSSSAAPDDGPPPPPAATASPARDALAELLAAPSYVLERLGILALCALRCVWPQAQALGLRRRWGAALAYQACAIAQLLRHLTFLAEHARQTVAHLRSRDPDESDRLRARLALERKVLMRPYRNIAIAYVTYWFIAYLLRSIVGGGGGAAWCDECRSMLRRYPLGSTAGDVLCFSHPPATALDPPVATCLTRPAIHFMSEPAITVEQTSPYCDTRLQRRRAETIVLRDVGGANYPFDGLPSYHVQMLLEVMRGEWPC